MFFSIIIPIYNVEKYLNKCVSSILKQDFVDFELLLINDCSTDNSLQIAQEYVKDNRVQLINKESNSGLSDTRNIGIRNAKGQYIIFIDSDDYVELGCFHKLFEVISENKFPDIVYTGFIEERGNNSLLKYGYASQKNRYFDGNAFLRSELKKRTLYAAACFGIYKRELLISNNLLFKSGIFHEDELWTPQVVYHANSVYTSEMAFYHYIRRNESITKVKDKTQNGLDLIESCNELDKIFQSIEDDELRRLMNNHIAMLYMKAMCRGKLYRKKYIHNIDKRYPWKRVLFIYDRIKAILFSFSLRLYYMIDLKIGDNEV
ncbi:glycosyltransferase family 2 protein [Anaerocolumna sp. MB42-C2]|uniref:glycosyltransferase family 2 protein n=1 Tax=Anaerocolumna sp. MB42-C2 TaxID=3070997 RepID=UPI0027DFD6C9|nr:glycosyltransferase [Anaerocolumna sp. MB42-C2]WMJ85814.1 glycosyltransferase [Anaerocolumna sp. MB42-C2]